MTRPASDTRVTDVMVPRAQMGVIDVDDPMSEIVPVVIEAAHSRFPVIDGDRDKVLGILLAKDLLRVQIEPDFDLRDWLRPAVFIPESKRLNVLLREFRVSRNHMAIVVNEYGGVAGLVTIEDVLEQIVGDIEDEYDFDEAHDNIRLDSSGRYRVKARTEIEDFNEAFATTFSDEELLHRLGGLGPVAEPLEGLLVVDDDARGLEAGLVGAHDLDETAVAGRPRVCGDDAVGGLLLLAHPHEAELDGHVGPSVSGVSVIDRRRGARATTGLPWWATGTPRRKRGPEGARRRRTTAGAAATAR